MSASRSSATQVASRYATAAFALARQAKKEALVVEEISAIAEAMRSHAELASAMRSPLVSRTQKSDILLALAKNAHALTAQSLQVIAAQGRAELLPQIAELLKAKLAEALGELIADVESARPLPDSVQRELAESLSRATGKTVKLNLKENPDLLGGVAVQIGSKRLDASLSAALSTMRRELLATNL